jgi:hypothetical protein
MQQSPKPAPKKPSPPPAASGPRPGKKIELGPVPVMSPGNEDLTAHLVKIATANAGERSIARLGLWKRILSLRALRRRWARAAKRSDELAKWGGGSILTFAAGLLIAGQAGWAVPGIAGVALLSFVGGTIFSAIFEARADSLELEEEYLGAVLQETEK